MFPGVIWNMMKDKTELDLLPVCSQGTSGLFIAVLTKLDFLHLTEAYF